MNCTAQNRAVTRDTITKSGEMRLKHSGWKENPGSDEKDEEDEKKK